MPDYQVYLPVLAVILFLMAALALARKPARIDTAGNLVLEYGWLLRGFALFTAFGVPFLLLVLLVFVPVESLEDLIIAAGMFVFFALLGSLLLIETMFVRITLSDQGITGDSPWRKLRRISWDAVGQVSYSAFNKWFVVIGPEQEKIRIPVLVRGVRSFVRVVQERVRPGRYEKAEPGFAAVDHWWMS